MIDWNIDVEPMLRGLQLSQSQTRARLRDIAQDMGMLVQAAWQEGANGHIYPGMSRPFTSATYRGLIAVGPVIESPHGASISIYAIPMSSGLRGPGFDLVASIEYGKESYDMKPGILASRSARISKKGVRYVIIPFRHGAGESVHFRTNVSREAKEVVQAYGKLNERTFGLATSRMANPWHQAAVLGPKHRLPPKHLPQTNSDHEWARRMFAGLKRVGANHHSQYMTWRAVTDHSAADSWIYPRVAPNAIFASMARAVEPEVRDAVEAALTGNPAAHP